jgi:hypothetical protein
MGWFSKLLGGDDIAKPIDAIGNAVDKIFTSDDERLTHAETKQRLQDALPELTAELDKLNAQSSVPLAVVARPFCVYVAGVNFFLLGIAVVWCNKGGVIPSWYIDSSTTGFLGALGLYGLGRTVEKLAGKAK